MASMPVWCLGFFRTQKEGSKGKFGLHHRELDFATASATRALYVISEVANVASLSEFFHQISLSIIYLKTLDHRENRK